MSAANVILDDAMKSSSDESSDLGTVGSLARQPQSELGSSYKQSQYLPGTGYDSLKSSSIVSHSSIKQPQSVVGHDSIRQSTQIGGNQTVRQSQGIAGHESIQKNQVSSTNKDQDSDDDEFFQAIYRKDKPQEKKGQVEESKDFITPGLTDSPKITKLISKQDDNLKPSLQKPAFGRLSTQVSSKINSSSLVQSLPSQKSTIVNRQSTSVLSQPKRTNFTKTGNLEDILDESSQSDDDSVAFFTKQKKTQINQRFTQQIEPQKIVEKPPIDILQIIEQNEKKNEPLLEHTIDKESQLLSFEPDHYEQKKEIIKYDQFAQLSAHIYDEKQKYFGVVSCIQNYGKYFFVGNSNGYIRVFDLESSKIADLRPLFDPLLDKNKVTCLHLTPGMQYLVSGYKSGSIALWDIRNYKLLKIINDVHATEVMSAKIFHITDENVINIVSAEVKGPVKLIEISERSFFGGLNHSKIDIYQQRLKTVTNIQIHQPSERQKQTYWGGKSLVVIGAVSEVVVCTMRPPTEVFKIKRPSICKPKSIPYFDFGYGLTPDKQDQTVLILAIAWDQMIQLVYFDEDRNRQIRMDGLYFTDSEINSCYFTGDSVLTILQNMKSVKMLYTKKFHHGDHTLLSNIENGQQIESESIKRRIREVTRFAELENGQEEKNWIKGVRRTVIETETDKYMNFSQTVVKFKRYIYHICDNKEYITRVSILTYQEYLDKLRLQNKTWLDILKTSLEIFSGELKGFSNLADEKHLRERDMLSFMKRQLFDCLSDALPQQPTQEHKGLESSRLENIAIKAAIEFCLNLQAYEFLFDQVCDYFIERNLQTEFIRGLEIFVLSGKFKTVKLPEGIIRRMIFECEKSEKFQQLERLIQQLDLTDYRYVEDLETLCQSKFMVSALLYILMTQSGNGRGDAKSCMNILNSMYKIMIQAQNFELKLQPDPNVFRIRRVQDLERLLGQISAEDKFELEKSHVYIGYKLLWIIQMFLKGKKFPYGDLTEPQWRQHIIDIVNFIQTDEYLKEIIEFDPQMFFRVIGRLFRGKPWQFLSEMQVNSQDCDFDPFQILQAIQTRGLKHYFNTKVEGQAEGDTTILDNFYVFILHVAVNQHEELKKGATGKPIAFGKKSIGTLQLDKELVLKAIENQLLLPKKQKHQSALYLQIYGQKQIVIDETLIIGALKATKLQQQDIEKLFKIIKEQEETSAYKNIQLELYESIQAYVPAFECLLQSKTQQMKVFEWLNKCLTTLQEDDKKAADYVALKSTARAQMFSLVQLEVLGNQAIQDQKDQKSKPSNQQSQNLQFYNFDLNSQIQEEKKQQIQNRVEELWCQKSFQLIKKWFADDEVKLVFSLVSQDLSNSPLAQFHLLKTFITLKEKGTNGIENTIKDSIYQPEKKKIADIYTSMLLIFTRRLCEFEETEVVRWVSKDYFPTRQCIDVCRSLNNYIAEAQLMEKVGDGIQAIKLYLQIIERVEVKQLSGSAIQIESAKDDRPERVGKLNQYETVKPFDQALICACQIAAKKNGDSEVLVYGEEGWFEILEYLSSYTASVSYKLDKAIKPIQATKNIIKDQAEKEQLMVKSFYNHEMDLNKRSTALKKFIMVRISYVLQRDDNKLQLRQVSERLGLEFEAVKKLCEDKLNLMKSDANIELRRAKIQQGLNFLNVQSNIQLVTEGIVIKASIDKKREFYQSQNRCQLCNLSLINSTYLIPYEGFVCGHLFHSTPCLKGRTECPVCKRQEIPYELEDTRVQENLDGRLGDQASINSKFSKQEKMRKKMRQLEVFDNQVENQYLSKTSFL